MEKIFAFLVALSALIFIPMVCIAVPASPDVVEIIQPDTKVVNVHFKGDEWNNWVETLDGFTIAQGSDGYWYYVSKYSGRIPVLSSVRVGEAAPYGLTRHLKPVIKNLTKDTPLEGDLQKAPYGTFNGKVLFILTKFSNRTGTYTPASFAGFIKNKIKGYFKKASYGKVTLLPATETHGTANDGVVGWVKLNYAHPNTGANTNINNQQITKDAILKADPYVNFTAFDTNHDGYVDASELAVVVIVAGFEQSYSPVYSPSVWGHKWSLDDVGAPVVDGVTVGAYHGGAGGYAQFGEIHKSKPTDKHMATLGIQVHELGHLIFSLPDLYDTDYSSSGVGAFCVMSGGNWGKASTDTYSGQRPVLPSAWIKYNRGWVDGALVDNATQSVRAAGSTYATSSNTVFRTTVNSTEYFIVENRMPSGYDKGFEKWFGTKFGGIAIWHVDESVLDNTNETHRMVDLEEADGIQMGATAGQKTDLWYVGNKTDFNSATDPNSKAYGLTDYCVSLTTKSSRSGLMNVEFTKESGCCAQVCGTFTPDCHPTISPCYCHKRFDGKGNCIDEFNCLTAEACATDADCPAGKACYIETCCGTPLCGPITCTGNFYGGPTIDGMQNENTSISCRSVR